LNDEHAISYTCPDPRTDFDQNKLDTEYVQPSQELTWKSGAEIWNYLQDSPDRWKRSYQQARHILFDWKSREFAPHLHNGSSIYESACGTGRNLALTLDIVRQVSGVTDLVVYGNDLSQENAVAAQILFRQVHPFQGNLGRICPGVSSTNLSHIPSDAFDLVYTSYITPLSDPLNFHYKNGGNETEIHSEYKSLCRYYGRFDKNSSSNEDNSSHGKGTNPSKRAFDEVQKMQAIQEEWYAAWTSELIRIARPGAPVLVEEISLPLCEVSHDFGGVSQDFWERAVRRYSWKVEKDSMHFTQAANGHYFLSMKKQDE